MNASLSVRTTTSAHMMQGRASFAGLLRGEFRKMLHLRILWVMTTLFTLFVVGLQLLLLGGNNKAQLKGDPLGFFYLVLEGDLSVLRIFSGIFLLILSAHVVGLEYQHGTIRILLGRGVGRLQLLGAKAAALALVGLAILAFELLVEVLVGTGVIFVLADGTHPWTILHDEVWVDVRVYLLYLLINASATLLLGVAASVVGRSLAFGLTAGLSWFAVDNLLLIPLSLLTQLTRSSFWRDASSFALGPLLNRLPDYIAPPYHVLTPGPLGHNIITTHQVSGFGLQPLIPISGAHALAVIATYSVIFAVVASVLTHRRDVLE